ncbi:MAG: hypothetical protein B1H04_03635, partial [Planctomycetales bacterium 4484_123]
MSAGRRQDVTSRRIARLAGAGVMLLALCAVNNSAAQNTPYTPSPAASPKSPAQTIRSLLAAIKDLKATDKSRRKYSDEVVAKAAKIACQGRAAG